MTCSSSCRIHSLYCACSNSSTKNLHEMSKLSGNSRQGSLVDTARNFGDILSTFVAVQITHRKEPIVRYAGCVWLGGHDHSSEKWHSRQPKRPQAEESPAS